MLYYLLSDEIYLVCLLSRYGGISDRSTTEMYIFGLNNLSDML